MPLHHEMSPCLLSATVYLAKKTRADGFNSLISSFKNTLQHWIYNRVTSARHVHVRKTDAKIDTKTNTNTDSKTDGHVIVLFFFRYPSRLRLSV